RTRESARLVDPDEGRHSDRSRAAARPEQDLIDAAQCRKGQLAAPDPTRDAERTPGKELSVLIRGTVHTGLDRPDVKTGHRDARRRAEPDDRRLDGDTRGCDARRRGARREHDDGRDRHEKDEAAPHPSSSAIWVSEVPPATGPAPDEIASTTRSGSSAARSATSATELADWASKSKKQISSSGRWIDCSNRTRVPSRVICSAAERAPSSSAPRSPAAPRPR